MSDLSNREAREQAQNFAWLYVMSAMNAQKVGFSELVERLAALGVRDTAGGISRRLSRKSFSAGFFLLCCQALELSYLDLERLRLTKLGLERQNKLEEKALREAVARRGPKRKPTHITTPKA